MGSFNSLAFCCCGCADETLPLNPDRYAPESICFVRTTSTYVTHIDVRIEIRREGEIWSETTEPRRTLESDPVITETTDNKLIAGNFTFIYPEEESESSTVEQNGADEITTITTITTQQTLEIDRKLAMLFDVNDQFAWEKTNLDGDPIIRSVELNLSPGEYRPANYPDDEQVDNELEVTVHGFWSGPEQALPETLEEFEELIESAENTGVINEDNTILDVTDWMPTENAKILTLVTGAEDSGYEFRSQGYAWLEMDLGSIIFGYQVDEEYDWHESFVRTDDGVYESTFQLPRANYIADFTNVIPPYYFNKEGNTLKIELFAMEEDEAGEPIENVYYDVSYKVRPTGESVEPDRTFFPDAPTQYYWELYSDGTRGIVQHDEVLIDQYNEFPSDPTIDIFGNRLENPLIFIRVREEVIERTGGKIAPDDHWTWVTTHAEKENDEFVFFPQFQVRISFTTIDDDHRPGAIAWKDISHPEDELNLECPHSFSCEHMEPYIAPEFDVIDFTIDSQSSSNHPNVRREWSACAFTYEATGNLEIEDKPFIVDAAYVERRMDYRIEQWDPETNPGYKLVYPPPFFYTGEPNVDHATACNAFLQSKIPVPVENKGLVGWADVQISESLYEDGEAFIFVNGSHCDPEDTFLPQQACSLYFVDPPNVGGYISQNYPSKMTLPSPYNFEDKYDYKVEVVVKDGLFDNEMLFRWPEGRSPGTFTEAYMQSDIAAIDGDLTRVGVGAHFVNENDEWVYNDQLFLHYYDSEFDDDEVDFLSTRLNGKEFWYGVDRADLGVEYYKVNAAGQEGPLDTNEFVPAQERLALDVKVSLTTYVSYWTYDDQGVFTTEPGTYESPDWPAHNGPYGLCGFTTVENFIGDYPPDLPPVPPEDWPDTVSIDVGAEMEAIMPNEHDEQQCQVVQRVNCAPDVSWGCWVQGGRTVLEFDLTTGGIDGYCSYEAPTDCRPAGSQIPNAQFFPTAVRFELPYVSWTNIDVGVGSVPNGSGGTNEVPLRTVEMGDLFNGNYVGILEETITGRTETTIWTAACRHVEPFVSTIEFVRKVPKWEDNEIPTVAFTGDDVDVTETSRPAIPITREVSFTDTSVDIYPDFADPETTDPIGRRLQYRATYTNIAVPWGELRFTLGQVDVP